MKILENEIFIFPSDSGKAEYHYNTKDYEIQLVNSEKSIILKHSLMQNITIIMDSNNDFVKAAMLLDEDHQI